jgi:hypothetical protein
MFSIFNKDGNVSVIRIGTYIAVFGVLVVVFAAIVFFIDQNARRSPLDIDAPPGAEYHGRNTSGATSQFEFYTIPIDQMTVEDVTQYYNDLLSEFDRTGDFELCVRSPSQGNYRNYAEGNGQVPYQFNCIFDNSGFNTTQFTQVTIQPGVFRPEADQNTEGLVVIRYEQQWSP